MSYPGNFDLTDSDPSDSSALIVLEGIDGSGTSTQAALLANALQARGYKTHVTKQPSLGPIGLLIRDILQGRHRLPDGGTPGEDVMALLFAADRADHIQREVIPAMDSGYLVISARWLMSSLAYQTAGVSAGGVRDREQWICDLNEQETRRPDCEIWLRVSPAVALARREAARIPVDRYTDPSFQERLAVAYERVMAYGGAHGDTIEVNGELGVQEVHEAVLEAVLAKVSIL